MDQIQNSVNTIHQGAITPINTLPPRVLVRILSLIQESQYHVLQEVNTSWAEYIDTHIGVPINIGRDSDFAQDKDLTFHPPSKLQEIGVSSCLFSNIYDLSIPDFKHPNIVRKLSFMDYITENMFLRILHDLTNLRHLCLDLSSLHYLQLPKIGQLEALTRLQTLQITNQEYSSVWNEDVHPSRNEVEITLYNVFSILNQLKFPKLNTLIIGFPKCSPSSRDEDFVLSIFQCLSNHSETIRKLEIKFDGSLESLSEDERENSIPENNLGDFNVDQLSVVSLRRIVMNIQEYHETEDLSNKWIEFLNEKKSLEECLFGPDFADEDMAEMELPTQVIENNILTLQMFTWYIKEAPRRTDPLEIDCTVFENCKVLKELRLIGPGSNPSTMQAINHLPQTLKIISIDGIRVRSSDVHSLSTEFKSLEKLKLSTIGQDGEFGMTMETLKLIMNQKSMKRLGVTCGFNRRSVEEVPINPDSFSFVQMIVSSKYVDDEEAFFHIKLCDNGEYAILS